MPTFNEAFLEELRLHCRDEASFEQAQTLVRNLLTQQAAQQEQPDGGRQLGETTQKPASTNGTYDAEQHEVRARYRALFDNSLYGVSIFTFDGKFIDINEQKLGWLGCTRADIPDIKLEAILPPDDLKRAEDFVQNVLDYGYMDQPVEFRILSRTGAVVHIETTGSTIYKDGKPWAVQSISKNITGQKAADERLRETEARYQSLFDNSVYAVYLLDFDGNFVDANQRALDWFGYTRADILHLHIRDLMPDEAQQQRAAQSIRHIVEHGHQPTPIEYRLTHSTGEPLIVESLGALIYRDGKPWAIQGIAHDITEQRAAEESLHQQEALLRTVMNHLPVLLLSIDRDGRYSLFGGAGSNEMGIDPDQIVGKTIYEVYPDRTEMHDEISRVLAGETIISERQAGDKIHDSYCLPMRDDEGNIIGVVGMGLDITQRKLVEDNYRKLAEYSLQALVILQDERIVFTNQAMADLTGYTVDELLTMSDAETLELLHPDDRYHVLSNHRARLAGDELPPRYEVRLTRKDGSVRWADIQSVVVDYHRRPAVQVALYDITERKQAEDDYRKLVDNSLQGVLIEQDRQLVFANQRALDITGYDAETLLGLPGMAIVHPRDRKRSLQYFENRLAGRYAPEQYEFRMRRANGEPRWVEARVVTTEYRGKPAVQMAFYDINERKLVEDAYRKLVDNSLQGVLVERNWEIVFANERAATITGHSVDELLGQPGNIIIPPGDHQRSREYGMKRLNGEFAPEHYEFELLRKDGSLCWVEARVVQTDYYGDRALQMAFSDISHRKQADTEQLERERLEVALQKEQELNHLKTRMMRKISHEFRTPLATIQSGMEMIQRYNDRLTDEQRSDRFEQGKQQIRQLTGILDDISIVVGGGLELTRDDVQSLDFAELCSAILDEARLGFAAEHEIRNPHGDNPYILTGNPVMLRRMLYNLLSNAVKFSAAGSTVTITIERDPRWLTLMVHDEGIGIQQEDLDRLTEPFFRGGNAGDFEGVGLGMTIIQQAIAAHRGTLTIQSTPETGTTVTITLPSAPPLPPGEGSQLA